jgi:hypothetical protein
MGRHQETRQMRGQKTASAPPPSPISPTTLIFGAAACFALGFAGLMLAPLILNSPRYVQVPAQEAAAIPAAAPAPAPAPATSPLVQEIKASPSATKPQAIPRLHTLADLSDCKIAIATGANFRGIGLGDVAAAVGGRPNSLSTREIDEGCRKLMQ